MCQISGGSDLAFLPNIKKSCEEDYKNAKIYQISSKLLWDSTTVTDIKSE